MVTLATFLQDFGTLIGIEGFGLDAEGQAQLSIGEVVVDLLGDMRDGRLLISCLFGELPEQGREGVMARLLDANAMLARTRGATIGIPAGSGAAVLARLVEAAHESPESFANMLVGFAETAEDLKALLRPVAADEAPSASEPTTMIRI